MESFVWLTAFAAKGRSAVTLACALGAVMTLASAASVAAAAQPIDVSARTTVGVLLEARGLELSAVGTLRDNSGAGLARRPILLSYIREGAESPSRMDTVRTNGAGEFETTHRLDVGQWRVLAEFGGEAFLAPSETEATTSLALLHATISGGPPPVVDAESSTFSFALTAEFMGAVLTSGAISVVSDGADVVERAPGQWMASVHDLTRPNITLVAVADPGGAGQPGRGEWLVRRAFDPRVAAQAVDLSSSFLQPRDVRVTATVRDIAGPIPGLQVRLIASDAVISEGVTDVDGRATVPAFDSVGAVVISVWLPEGTEVARTPVTLPSTRTMPQVSGWIFLVLALGILFVVVVSWARELRSLPAPVVVGRSGGGGVEPISFELAADRGATQQVPRFFGRVVDAETQLRVDATLSLDGVGLGLDDRGGFDVEATGWEATASMVASAEGYRTVHASMSVPSTGRHVVVRLAPLRLELLQILKGVVSEVTPEAIEVHTWWGTSTVREVWQATAESVRGLQRASERSPVSRVALKELLLALESEPRRHEAAEALGRLVERGYFGARRVTEADIALAQRLAAIVVKQT
ncbi:MAG: hypothetical protein ACJA1R_000591 [Flavobacteriales bacterium]